MDYVPAVLYSTPATYYGVLDDAIRGAAFRNITVQLLIGKPESVACAAASVCVAGLRDTTHGCMHPLQRPIYHARRMPLTRAHCAECCPVPAPTRAVIKQDIGTTPSRLRCTTCSPWPRSQTWKSGEACGCV